MLLVAEELTYRLVERPHALVEGSEDSMKRCDGLRSLPLELDEGGATVESPL